MLNEEKVILMTQMVVPVLPALLPPEPPDE